VALVSYKVLNRTPPVEDQFKLVKFAECSI